ncbi:MAG: hypothetical protein MI747_12185, partial [Desulfobacterales bacterium]|nr:hypothetical protein [Desulfobacterales bacterium]
MKIPRLSKPLLLAGATRIGGTASGMLLSIVLTRLFAPGDAGAAFFLISLVQLLAVVCRMGMDHHIVAAFTPVDHRSPTFISGVETIGGFGLVNGLVLGLGLFAVGIRALFFPAPHPADIPLAAALALPFFTLSTLLAFFVQSRQRTEAYIFYRNVLWQILVILCLPLCFSMGLPPVAAVAAGMVLSPGIIARMAPEFRGKRPRVSRPGWINNFQRSRPYVGATLTSMLLQVGPTVLAGFLLAGEQVALLSVGSKIAALQFTIAGVLNAHAGPRHALG